MKVDSMCLFYFSSHSHFIPGWDNEYFGISSSRADFVLLLVGFR